MTADICCMTNEVQHIQAALAKMPEAAASFVNVVFFREDGLGEPTGSILPFRLQGNVTYDTAFHFQETIRQVVRMQESRGFVFDQQRVGVIVADQKMHNAEMILDAVVGVFRTVNSQLVFTLATDRSRWLNTMDQSSGEVTPLDKSL